MTSCISGRGLSSRIRPTSWVARQDLGELRTSLVGVGELVEGHDLPGDGPSDADFAVRVAGDESRLESGPRLDGQVIDTAAQYPADAVKRVAGTAAVPGLGLLHPAAHVINHGQGQAHDV